MIELSICNNLLDQGFSLVTVSNKKVPNYKWKKLQTKPLTKKEFYKRYNYKGGFFFEGKSGEKIELPPTENVGLITGFADIEAVDVDLKVFSTAREQKDFWELLITYLEDSIFDFHDKFVITKTMNSGYHILYKTKRVKGNLKLAVLKNHTEAVIETRGQGGYVFIYDNFLNNKYYTDIKYVSDEDRNILMDIIDSFDDKKEKTVIEQPKKVVKTYNQDVTPWEEFNDRNSVFDIVSDEFEIVRKLSNKTVIRRNGADSVHSGYIFNDNGCMYLHSTGTIYPHQKQISAYNAWVIKKHGGDYSKGAKQAYDDGYGDRLKIKPPETKKSEIQEQKQRLGSDIKFPLEIFPNPFQKYILDCAETLGASIDYMGCSLLWCISLITGNSYKVSTKRGWEQSPVLWFALVGDTGVGKTPSINNILRPLKKENGNEIKQYIKDLEKFNLYDELDKQDKDKHEEVGKPVKKQFIIGDATIEALIQLHQQSPNSVGIHKDELAGWIKDFNKYRDGSDKESFLSIWDGEPTVVNRVKNESNAYLPQPFIPILGGIQPNILDSFYTDDNKDSGFVDRILLSYPDIEIPFYNEKEMDKTVIDWYDNAMTNLYRNSKNNIELNENDEIDSKIYELNKESKKEWVRIYNEIVKKERSDDENEYLKSMLPKQKKYIPRFALIIELLQNAVDEVEPDGYISKKSMLGAEKLSEYFIFMAKKLRIGSKENKEIKDAHYKNQSKGRIDIIKELYKKNPDFNRTKAAQELDVSRRTIINDIKRIDK
jgi:hypothetical protein